MIDSSHKTISKQPILKYFMQYIHSYNTSLLFDVFELQLLTLKFKTDMRRWIFENHIAPFVRVILIFPHL
jgi:hypothetical protein